MTLTPTAALGGPNGAADGGLTVQWDADGWSAPPTITSQKVRPPTAVRSVLIYDEWPDARAALTLRVTAAVPSLTDITCTASPADLITAFDGCPADLVFIGVERQAGGDVHTAALFLRRYPTATVIVVGTINDIPLLTTALARGAVGLMLWKPWHDHPRYPPRHRVRNGGQGHTVSRAERGILQGMSRGLSNREIGVHLDLSEETVKSRSRVLYGKLGARDRAHAVALALRQQLLS